ncbi:M3 family oligoendopeptidase [Ornithinibacillus bavariensis]|uniref:Oligoendopeptidase F n=1 Tax=Ornithinibacillus bavariensis TaxID=545502 RepID=A0A920C587_9BACI|nr:M3 family oligoendopeptidase [Ornithinibacillus bavariensis]GIO26546.1 oligoendopeptidase F [Ornithinibacillus bavariensis]HAM80174.1 M3 family oligoendopeptidase [Ornithinibacillus sp.]
MKTFEDYTYERPELDQEKKTFSMLLEAFVNANSVEEQNKAIEKINAFRNRLSTMFNLVYIRASIDTNDEFYQNERDYWDEILPEIQKLNTDFYKELIKTPYRAELEKKWGSQLFKIADYSIKAFSPEVMGLLQKENKLTSEYAKLVASAQVEFNGKTYTLAQLGPFLQDKDRDVRKKAASTSAGFFEANADKFDEIYDQLVKLRHEIAITLGYKNFVELAYIRMMRIDYNAEMVANFRKQVQESIVPLVSKIFDKQRERIGLDSLKYYDENFQYNTGNATPKGSPEWIIENGKKMYEELSPETNEFFHFMIDRKLMDLEAKKGKESGGYCTFIEDYESPFIFSNFNGTSGDIDVLTHEAGHAFQIYQSRSIGIPEYLWPTNEAAEIHSMSMEFFAWPWMELFFKEDTEKYKYSHLSGGLSFLPYGVAVDEFQHLVYENPDWTPEDRKEAWKKLEEKYLPHRDYDDMPYWGTGAIWQRQGHIYESPFYYIDYTLAQICAFQFWKRSRENRKEAWNDYLNLCKLGGSKPFLGLVEAANLLSPFEDGTIDFTVKAIEEWLDAVDDKKL